MKTDALGGKPLVLTLAQMLRLAEAKIHGLVKQKKAGQEYTLPSMSNEGEITEPQLLDDLITNWEKEKAHLKAVIAWAETRKPGSSRKGNGELLLDEYEKSIQEN